MPKKETPHLRIRLEPRLLARLEKAREKTGRTLTGEIAHRLEDSFRRQEQADLLGGLRAIREAIGLPRDIADLPPDTPVSSLTVDHLDQLRRKLEQERASKLPNEKETAS